MLSTRRWTRNVILSMMFTVPSAPLLADDCVTNKLQVNGLSYHFTRNAGYNERNYGVGFERTGKCDPIDLGYSVGYMRNSFNRDAGYGLVIATANAARVSGGGFTGAPYAAVGVATNYPEWVGGYKGHTKPVGLVGVSVGHSSGWGINLGVIPVSGGLILMNITKEF